MIRPERREESERERERAEGAGGPACLLRFAYSLSVFNLMYISMFVRALCSRAFVSFFVEMCARYNFYVTER